VNLRWWNRYWYFPELPDRILCESSPYYSPEIQQKMMEESGKVEKTPNVFQTEIIFPEENLKPKFSVYTTQEDIDGLLRSLDKRGDRERRLSRSIQKNYSKIVCQMTRTQNEIIQNLADSVVRRSSRIKATEKFLPQEPSFLSYVNRYVSR
jgi:hypothetical protein